MTISHKDRFIVPTGRPKLEKHSAVHLSTFDFAYMACSLSTKQTLQLLSSTPSLAQSAPLQSTLPPVIPSPIQIHNTTFVDVQSLSSLISSLLWQTPQSPSKSPACLSALHRPLRDFAHSPVVLFLVGAVQLGGFRVGRGGAVGVLQQALDAGQDGAHALAG